MERQIFLLHGGLQFIQQDAGDFGHALLIQMTEADHFVQPVQEFRPQELLQGLHGLILCFLLLSAGKAHGSGTFFCRSGVAGHNDDRIGEIHPAAMGIGNVAVIQNL